jgi:AcrR family transcriptional regulator
MDAAGELFATLGYPGSTVNMIVERAGVTPAALYWHFESKEDLLNTLLMEGADRFKDEIQGSVGEAHRPPEVLHRLVVGHTMANLTIPQVARIDFSSRALAQWLTQEHYETYQERQREFFGMWREVIKAGVSSGDFDVEDTTISALAIFDMCEGAMAWFNADGPLSPAAVADQYGVLALRLVGYAEES